jgi:hypothetical protein
MTHVVTTIDQAVDYLLAELSPEDQDLLREMEADDLWSLHMGLGMAIRNHFKLWQGNDALLAECGSYDPDAASNMIIDALWRRLRNA